MSSEGPVLVTGGAGRVGRYVARELRRDRAMRVADLRPGEVDAEFALCDVTDLAAVRAAIEGATAVCHLAGLDYDTHSAPEDFVRVNTVGTWNVLQAAAEHGVGKVVLASSSAAYGLFDLDPSWVARYLPIDELHPYRPFDAYSLSKLVTEQMGATWARSTGMSVICLQPLHVVMRETYDEFLAFVDAIDQRWPHNYVAAEDVATAFRCAVEAEGIAFDTFLVGARDTPLAEPTLAWYEQRFGALPELRNARLYRESPRASLFSVAKARDVLGWEPRLSLEDIAG